MHRLSVFAAASAAGVIAFAIGSAHAAPLNQRAGFSQPPVVSSPTAAKAEKTKDDKAAKRSKTGKRVTKATAKKKHRTEKKHPTRTARRTTTRIDLTQTASIRTEAGAPSVTSGDSRYSAIIARYASEYGVPASLAQAVIQVESNYRPNLTGSAGEVGLMQIKPATARMLGYGGSVKALYDPDTNIKYGMKYLAMAQDLGGGTTCGTILKYNAGHAARRMNPVSSAYCRKVKVQMASAGDPA
jgi:soluble lytic murein transglycosylase-like protein